MDFGPDDAPDFEYAYYQKVILPDEKSFLLSPATEHMLVVPPGTVEGEKIEFIVDGKVVIPDELWREWKELWGEYTRKDGEAGEASKVV